MLVALYIRLARSLLRLFLLRIEFGVFGDVFLDELDNLLSLIERKITPVPFSCPSQKFVRITSPVIVLEVALLSV